MKFLAVALLFFLSVFGMEDKQSSSALSSEKEFISFIIGVPHGPKLDEIMNTFSKNGYNVLEDSEYEENEAKLKSFGFRTLHLNRWKKFFDNGSIYVMPEEKDNFQSKLSSIISVPPGPQLDEIMNAFSQNGYNALEDLEFIENEEDEEELKSFGLTDLHLKLCKDYFDTEDFYVESEKEEEQSFEIINLPQNNGNLYVEPKEEKSFDVINTLSQNTEHVYDVKLKEAESFESITALSQNGDNTSENLGEDSRLLNFEEWSLKHMKDDTGYYAVEPEEKEENDKTIVEDEEKVFEKIAELIIMNREKEYTGNTLPELEYVENEEELAARLLTSFESKKLHFKIWNNYIKQQIAIDEKKDESFAFIQKDDGYDLDEKKDDSFFLFQEEYDKTIDVEEEKEENDKTIVEDEEKVFEKIAEELIKANQHDDEEDTEKREEDVVEPEITFYEKNDGSFSFIQQEVEDDKLIDVDEMKDENFFFLQGEVANNKTIDVEEKEENDETNIVEENEENEVEHIAEELIETDQQEDIMEPEKNWICDLCAFSNISSAQICEMCEGKTPGSDTISNEITNCPGNHGLKRFKTSHDNFWCDTCGNKFRKGTTMNGCRECDFDLCTICSKNVMITNCPGNHGLKRFETPHDNFGCDDCGNTFKTGTTMNGCRKCNFDLCTDCSGNVMNPLMNDDQILPQCTNEDRIRRRIEDFKNRLRVWIRELIEVYKKHEIQKIQNVWEEVNRRARKIWEIQNFQNALKESDAKVKKFIKDIKSHSKAGINGTYESIEQKVETLVEKTKTQVNHGKEKFQNDAQSVIDTMNKVPEFYSKAKNNIGNCVGKECEKLTKLKFW